MIGGTGRLAVHTFPKTDPIVSSSFPNPAPHPPRQETVVTAGAGDMRRSPRWGFFLLKVPVRMSQCSRTHKAS